MILSLGELPITTNITVVTRLTMFLYWWEISFIQMIFVVLGNIMQ